MTACRLARWPLDIPVLLCVRLWPRMDERIHEHIGRPHGRFEDAALLMGRARFADDLPVPRGTLHAAIVRSPHAHAEILSIDPARALAMPGIECVVTGRRRQELDPPVRYAGEPVAVILASDRCRAEDALEAVRKRNSKPRCSARAISLSNSSIKWRRVRHTHSEALGSPQRPSP